MKTLHKYRFYIYVAFSFKTTMYSYCPSSADKQTRCYSILVFFFYFISSLREVD